jgi:hypothetical protein
MTDRNDRRMTAVVDDRRMTAVTVDDRTNDRGGR